MNGFALANDAKPSTAFGPLATCVTPFVTFD
jgi:hypothetical protein